MPSEIQPDLPFPPVNPAEPAQTPSESDDRVSNNSLRHQYRILSDAEKDQMVRAKDLGLSFINLLHEIGGTDPLNDPENPRFASRDLALANTHIEDAVMRAVRHITR